MKKEGTLMQMLIKMMKIIKLINLMMKKQKQKPNHKCKKI